MKSASRGPASPVILRKEPLMEVVTLIISIAAAVVAVVALITAVRNRD
jgi:hypothetical protein